MWKMQPLLTLLVHFWYSTSLLVCCFFRFIALVFTKAFLFLFEFFGAFTKYVSLSFLLVLPAAVCIVQHLPYQNDCIFFNSVNRLVNSTYNANVLNKFLIFWTDCSVNIAVDMSMNGNTIVSAKIFQRRGFVSYWDQFVGLQCW